MNTVQTIAALPYATYKDSGVDWLGEIPSHWEVASFFSIFRLKSNKNRPELEVLSVYREYGVVKKDSRDDNHNATSLDTSGYKAVLPGDLVINKMKAWQGSMGISPYEGIVSPAYITCSLNRNDVSPEFLHILLRSYSLIGEYNKLSYGVRIGQWDMHFEDLKKLVLPIPPLPEQEAIAAYLDRKCAEIDHLIAKQEQLLALLDEQRQILINDAVTRGLDPTVPMKDSGIDWLGEIPSHWEVRKLGYCSKITTGNKNTENNLEAGGYPFYVRSQTIQKIDSFSYDCEGILTAGDGVGVGRVFHYANGKFDVHQRVYLFYRIIKELSTKFVFYFLRANMKNELMRFNSKSTVDSIRLPVIRNFPVCIPPKPEQLMILESIEKIEAQFNKTHSSIQHQIALLKEYKQVLIHEAVTGKIQVPNL